MAAEFRDRYCMKAIKTLKFERKSDCLSCSEGQKSEFEVSMIEMNGF